MKYFTQAEFACKCGCGFDDIDLRLVSILDRIREYFDKPMHVNSGCRCIQHNINEGGAPRSQHLFGRAADVRIDGIPGRIIAELALLYGATGVKVYDSFVHIDVRDGVPWIA